MGCDEKVELEVGVDGNCLLDICSRVLSYIVAVFFNNTYKVQVYDRAPRGLNPSKTSS